MVRTYKNIEKIIIRSQCGAYGIFHRYWTCYGWKERAFFHAETEAEAKILAMKALNEVVGNKKAIAIVYE